MARLPGPFIVIYGDEEFLQDRFVEGRKATWKNRQIIERDSSRISEGELVTLCESRSFFDENDGRAIILDNAQDLKTDKLLEQYIEERDSKDLSAILLVVIRGNKIAPVWQKASKKGLQFSYLRLKPWETEKAVTRIVDEAQSLGLKLDKGVGELIYRYTADLRSAVNELVKLTYLVGGDKLVKKEHLGRVVVLNQEVEPKHVSEAAMAKNQKLAADRLSRIFKLLGEGACVPVVSSCLYSVEKILIARQMLDQGDSISSIAERFGMHEYACKLNIIPLAHKHTVKSLLGHMNHLCKLDAQVKGAARSKRTLVELAVLSIAA